MLWSPALWSGGDCRRLPLASVSGFALIDVLLQRPAKQAVGRLLRAVQSDPGLALWVACRASLDAAEPLGAADEAARWLVERGGEGLIWPDETPQRPGAATAEQTIRLAVSARETAVLARELAVHRGAAPSAAEQAYWLGLLYDADPWLALDAPAATETAPEAADRQERPSGLNFLPAWLSESLAGLSPDDPVKLAREILSGRAEMPGELHFDRQAVAAQARETLTSNADELLPLLPLLSHKLTRLRELETQFQERLEADRLEAMAELAAGAGHEINNPIAVIAGRAQLFLREERDPERRRELAVMNGQAMRVYEMISDMMLFARPPQPKLADCDLAALTTRVLAELAPALAERRIATESEGTGEPLVIQADPDQLGVALKALLENALESMPQGGRIDVRLRRISPAACNGDSGGQIELVVRDNGPGISPEIRLRMFDPFYSGRSAGRGLGMGLSKCWRIITNHGGRIEVESELGRGATFIICLPVAADRLKSAAGNRADG
ncbi:MAG TPA: ATP-binding protein [Pirellulales bacterium]|nr:ATP-binding protein [Pirellulales bacterium]